MPTNIQPLSRARLHRKDCQFRCKFVSTFRWKLTNHPVRRTSTTMNRVASLSPRFRNRGSTSWLISNVGSNGAALSEFSIRRQSGRIYNKKPEGNFSLSSRPVSPFASFFPYRHTTTRAHVKFIQGKYPIEIGSCFCGNTTAASLWGLISVPQKRGYCSETPKFLCQEDALERKWRNSLELECLLTSDTCAKTYTLGAGST